MSCGWANVTIISQHAVNISLLKERLSFPTVIIIINLLHHCTVPLPFRCMVTCQMGKFVVLDAEKKGATGICVSFDAEELK